jgi:hypothetical protein
VKRAESNAPVAVASRILREAVEAERQACIRDACGYCAGHYPQYDRRAIGPNAASNWVHPEKDVRLGPVRRLGRDEKLCAASSIHNRALFLSRVENQG